MPWVKLTWSALLLLAGALNAATLQGKVIGVADGDTVTLLDDQKNQHIIRLQGIDAPEKAQAFGNKSKQSLHEMVHGKEVFVDVQKKDKYGRSVGKILVNQTDACLEQIKRGMAWHYKQYANEQSPEDRDVYAQAESTARAQSLGLWKDKSPTPPWAFRKQNK
ncbi:MAG: thermonuclease family protein [Betaproteobacteria bacterium]|jgi:endonuclease YncB( thermonuclease family)|nr:thermonuclease family protein [Betaproteobacteria bacterium]